MGERSSREKIRRGGRQERLSHAEEAKISVKVAERRWEAQSREVWTRSVENPSWERPDHSEADVVCPEIWYAYQEKSWYRALCPSLKWLLFANRGTDREVNSETLAAEESVSGVSITRAASVILLRLGYHPSVVPQYLWVDTVESCVAACNVFEEINGRHREERPGMKIPYGFDSEYMTSPERMGNYFTLKRELQDELELTPCNKEMNGPYLLYIQLTAPEFTTAIFDLRRICKTVGWGKNKRSLLPPELRRLLVNTGIVFSLCGGGNDLRGLKVLFGLDSRRDLGGDGKNSVGYLELQDWSWRLGYKLYTVATAERGPVPMDAALWRLVALGLGFKWVVHDANDKGSGGMDGPDFIMKYKKWFSWIPGDQKPLVFLRKLSSRCIYYIAQDPAYTMYATYILLFTSARETAPNSLREFRDVCWSELQILTIGGELAEGDFPPEYKWVEGVGRKLVKEEFVETYIREKGKGEEGLAIYYICKVALLSAFQDVANRLVQNHSHASPLERMRVIRKFFSWVGKKWRSRFNYGHTLNPSRDPLSEDGRSRSRVRRRGSTGQRSLEAQERRRKQWVEKKRIRAASASLSARKTSSVPENARGKSVRRSKTAGRGCS